MLCVSNSLSLLKLLQIWFIFLNNSFLKQKNKAFAKFLEFKNQVEKELDAKIKCLRVDNGLEYMEREFLKFYEDNGI